MSWNNRVVWSEGMFLRPQHFQQQDRYIETLVESRSHAAQPGAWGFSQLLIDSAPVSYTHLTLPTTPYV